MKKEHYPINLQSHIFDAFCNSVDRQHIYICDVETNIWRWSPYSVNYFGLPDEVIQNLPEIWMEKVHPDDRKRVTKAFEELFSGESMQHSCEYRVKNREGDYVWVLCRGCMVYDEDNHMDLCAGILSHLGQENKFDSVTGLLSIHEFRRILKDSMKEPNRIGGILLIGVDHFRKLNKSGNYDFGNEFLSQYAKKLLDILPKEATVFRMDGDKFAFLCQEAKKEDIKQLFMKAFALAEKGIRISGERFPFTISAGAVLYPENGMLSDELYTNLEFALEASKKNNREGITFFTEQLQQENMERFQFLQKLKESIEHNFEGFYLCYQPTVTVDETHTLVGAEALLRWFHPHFGFVSPAAFIPILEESGKIIQVGKWVFSTAIAQVKQWLSDQPNMKISVNVSLLQFMDDTFHDFVLSEIERIDFPKRQLILELTESCNVIHPNQVQEELNFFRKNGIQIALDDFGTGYASLSVLRDLTADWIKVDHSFVAQIAQSDFDQALTESLIKLCKKLNLNVCVEGIETEEIQAIIQKYEPTMMQGYLYSRPLDTKQFELQYIKKKQEKGLL